jgi:hypothetical protein
VVNHIYHCRTFCSLDYSVRRNGKNYETWQIHLYNGNNPEWLELYVDKLLGFEKNELEWEHVKKIVNCYIECKIESFTLFFSKTVQL